jgi:hypothetical protein
VCLFVSCITLQAGRVSRRKGSLPFPPASECPLAWRRQPPPAFRQPVHPRAAASLRIPPPSFACFFLPFPFPLPALPCPALPCPALPCAALR